MTTNQSTFFRCCYGYGISGMSVLVIGSVLPSIMREADLNYTVAGGLLSMMAVGNLLSSFFFPVLTARWGKRLAISFMAALVPVCLFFFTLLPPVALMYLLLFLAGIARGSITIINNATVNIISHNSGKALNLLHCSFAIGAFLSPFLTTLLIGLGFGWRSIFYLIILLCISSAISYATMEYESAPSDLTDSPIKESGGIRQKDHSYLKNPMFYCLGFLLFFYLGTENCINGWFVTYLQSTGSMSESYAGAMVSVTWIVIMVGRLVCASLSKYYSKSLLILVNAVGSAVCFFFLILSSGLTAITLSLVGLGFFLAGIYPTAIADAGQYTKGSTAAISLLTAISSLGGILTPQLVGSAADRMGIVAAVGFLGVNASVVVLLALINYRKRPKPMV